MVKNGSYFAEGTLADAAQEKEVEEVDFAVIVDRLRTFSGDEPLEWIWEEPLPPRLWFFANSPLADNNLRP